MKTLIDPIYERCADDENPFAGDAFEREAFANNLTNLLVNSDDGLVLTIDAGWGEGKTTFVNMWRKQLAQNEQILPVYYNSFENDFHNDPFVSIASTIEETLRKHAKDANQELAAEQLSYLKTATKNLAVEIAKITTSVAVSSATAGMVSSKGWSDSIGKAVRNFLFGTLEVQVDDKFGAYAKKKQAVSEYQGKLRSVLDKLGEGTNKRIVVLIDELDRCRPSFAIEVIEKVKHLFNAERVFFVLAINKPQLLKTIGAVYGVGEDDTRIYLEKFVHVETQLPPEPGVDSKDNPAGRSEFVKSLFEEFEIPTVYGEKKDLLKVYAEFSGPSRTKLNPRAVERVMTLVAIARSSCAEALRESYTPIFFLMACLRSSYPDVYQAFSSGKFFNGQEVQREMWEWMEEFLKKELGVEKEMRYSASNVFEIDRVRDACKILDIYHLPAQAEDDPENKYSKEAEAAEKP